MFNALNSVMGNNEQIKLTVTKHGDILTVLVQSVLAEPIKEADADQIKQIKMALATPLVLKGTAEQLNQSFIAQLSDFGAVKASTSGVLQSSMKSVKEASKQAVAVNKPITEKVVADTKPTTEEEPPVIHEESITKPAVVDSLFF